MSLDTAAQATGLLKMPMIVGDRKGWRPHAHAVFAAQCPEWQLQEIGSGEVAVALATA